MKRNVTLIFSIVIIILAIIFSKYYERKQINDEIKKFNFKYEQFNNKEILGTEIATVINQAVDDNEKAYIKKDEKGKYIQDDVESVNIEVKITDLDDKIYTMETLYNGGMSEFVKYYNTIKFKCTNIQYNSTGRVKYMLFEQTSS